MKRYLLLALFIIGCTDFPQADQQTLADDIEALQEQRLEQVFARADCEISVPFIRKDETTYRSILTCDTPKSDVTKTIVFHNDGEQTQWKLKD